MHLALTGATGFVGSEVLQQALAASNVDHLAVLGRRPVGHAQSKLIEIVSLDFLNYERPQLPSLDACIWCLGVSQLDESAEDYVCITFDYAVAAASAASLRRLHAVSIASRTTSASTAINSRAAHRS